MEELEIVGHRRQRENLKKQIDSKRVSHSYLFQGREGIGKKKIAQAFSKSLLCEEGGSVYCGSCSSCRKFDQGNHPDFQLITGENNIIKKGQVDRLVEAVKTKPFESEKKIFLIDNAHEMNKESMNGLLKTLEEAPDFMEMILITDKPELLLDTIRSRCEIIKFYRLGREDIRTYLESRGVSSYNADFIASISEGSIRLAEDYASQPELMDKREKLIRIIDSLLSGNKAAAFNNTDFFLDNRQDLDLIFSTMILWFRDLAIYKETGNIELLVNSHKEDLFSNQSHIHFNRIDDIIGTIEKTSRNIKNNVNFELSIEMMLLNIQEDN